MKAPKTEMELRQTTVCFLVRHRPQTEVLLGYKKTGFGKGKYAGIGGKVEAGETVEQAAIREVAEEIGVDICPEALSFVGTVQFVFPWRTEWSQRVAVFVTDTWNGAPVESEEMRPCWFRLSDIPYQLMWKDAVHWLPTVLEGRRTNTRIWFGMDNETVDQVSRDEIA